MDNNENDKKVFCYASSLGGCDGQSSEHYMSDSILRLLTPEGHDNRYVYVKGLPGQRKESERKSIKSLGQTILCRKHNSALSQLDTEACKFFERVKQFAPRIIAGQAIEAAERDTDPINADLLERWVIKHFYGFIYSDHCEIDGRRPQGEPDHEVIKYLFGVRLTRPYPVAYQLLLNLQPDRRTVTDHTFVGGGLRVTDDSTGNTHIIGVMVSLFHVELVMSMFPVDITVEGARRQFDFQNLEFRPRGVVILNPDNPESIVGIPFTWKA